MKKFRFKSLEVLRPKYNMGWIFIALAMVLGISACSDDDDDTPSFQFPEKQTIRCSAADTRELTFEANGPWSLTSSELWCRFLVDGVEEYSLSGNTGRQTVSIVISDESQKPEMTNVAHLTLMSGEAKAIIADVIRNAPGREFKITDGEGNELEVLEAGYDGFVRFRAQANFRFAMTDRPDWVKVEGGSMVGAPGKVSEGGLQIATDGNREKYAIAQEAGYTVTFSDEDGLAVYTYPVIYKGMNPDALVINGPDWFNWEASLDGKTFTQTGTSGVEGTATTLTYNRFVPFTIQTLSDKYVPVFIEMVEEGGVTRPVIGDDEYPVEWMHITDKDGNGNVRVTVDELGGGEREGYVLVFSQAKYDSMKDDLYGNLLEMDTETGRMQIKYKYTQNNTLLNVVQKEKKTEPTEEAAFKVTYYDAQWNQVEADLTKVTDAGIASEFGTESIYSMSQPDTPKGFNVDPLMEGELEVTWSFEALIGGDKFDNTDERSVTCDDGKNLTVFLSSPVSEEIHILIKDKTTLANKKVLIITPNN